MNFVISALHTAIGQLGIDTGAQSTLQIAYTICALLALSLVFRIVAGLIYYSNISALILFSKPIEKKEDIKKTPSPLINRCVADYMACGETGAPLSQIDAIIKRNLLRMNVMGITLKTFEKFGYALEMIALAAMAGAVISTGEAGWLMLMGGLYLIFRIVLLFFDNKTLSEKLFYGLTTYINREIGKFYINDDKAGLRIFKNEMHSSLMEQASILQNSINNLTSTLSSTVKASYEDLQKSIVSDLKKYDDLGEKLREPVENFAKSHKNFDESSKLLAEGARTLSQAISVLDEKVSVITSSLDKNSEANNKNIKNSELVFYELRDGLKSFNAAYSALEAELAAVKQVEASLTRSYQKYESSLHETVSSFGDVVGRIAEYKGKEATDTLNEAIFEHVKQFQNDTHMLLEKMTAIFEQAYEQNKSEMQTLLRIENAVKK